MIDMFIRYQVNIFVDVADILPETSTISKLLELFKDKGLIPSNINELTGEGPKLRLRMSSPDNQWNITFLTQKIHIERNCNPNQPPNEWDVFFTNVKKFSRKIFEYLERKSSRLAFIVEAVLKEKTLEQLQQCYNKLFIPLPTYKANPPFEWNNRSISQKETSLVSTTEKVNIITEIKRIKAQLKLDGGIKTTDRLLLQYEFNTAAENKSTRFSAEEFDSFIDIAKDNYNDMKIELESVLNG